MQEGSMALVALADCAFGSVVELHHIRTSNFRFSRRAIVFWGRRFANVLRYKQPRTASAS
jgi:hypothetical protein